MAISYEYEAKKVINYLLELNKLTADTKGAHRVAWTPTWDKALSWFSEKMTSLGANVSTDAINNIYAEIPGESEEALCIGSHLDSVPDGGWLDGALGVVTGIGIAEYLTRNNKKPAKTLYIVNWADEEGARFGRSCIGSSAASGSLLPQEIVNLKDKNGILFSNILKNYHTKPENLLQAHDDFLQKNIQQYIELHIEQAPVLEKQGISAACVEGICGCERLYITFKGQRSHLGCPIDMRNDAFLAAAQAALAFRKIALDHTTNNNFAYCTVGEVKVEPNVINVVPDNCTISLDLRTLDKNVLQSMYHEAIAACQHAAAENNVTVSFKEIWQIPPTHFDSELIKQCKKALANEIDVAPSIISGPLHDAAEIAKMVPSVMMFIQSENGLSHCKEENTSKEALIKGISSFFRLADFLINNKSSKEC